MSDRFVVDTSVVMAWCFEDEQDGYAEAVIESLENREALVPRHLWQCPDHSGKKKVSLPADRSIFLHS